MIISITIFTSIFICIFVFILIFLFIFIFVLNKKASKSKDLKALYIVQVENFAKTT